MLLWFFQIIAGGLRFTRGAAPERGRHCQARIAELPVFPRLCRGAPSVTVTVVEEFCCSGSMFAQAGEVRVGRRVGSLAREDRGLPKAISDFGSRCVGMDELSR